jgi:VWFA-related protein
VTRAAVAVATCCAALPLAVALAQPPPDRTQAPQQQPSLPTFRAGANIVRVDATVVDRRGEPVRLLTAADFELKEDGVPQKIELFQFVEANGSVTPGDDRSLEIRSPEHAAVEAARDDVRVFLIFWDEYHIDQFVGAITGRRILLDFLTNAVGPTDLVALMDPLLPADAIRFTRDRYTLEDAVRKLRGRAGVYVPPRSPVEEEHLRLGSDIESVRFQVTFSALMSAAAQLGSLREGRSAILFVGDSFRRGGGSSPAVQDAIRAANDHNVAFYPVGTRGLGPRASDLLLDLASSTGGQAFLNNAPEIGLRQVVRRASAYYVLGYSADRSPADGRFHKINVRVNRPGMEVRARAGFRAPTVGDLTRARAKAVAAEPTPPVADAQALLAAASGRRAFDLWMGSARALSGRTEVTIAWAPHAGEGADGVTSIELVAEGADGEKYFEGAAVAHRLSFVSPPGAISLKIAAHNAAGEIVERDTRQLQVPDFSGGALALSSPVLLRAQNPRELRGIKGDPDAPPFAGRDFRRTERLFVRFRVYGDAAPRATVSARLMNRGGAVLAPLPVVPVAGRDGMYEVELALGSVANGDFLIAVEATRGEERVDAIVPLRIVS